MLERIRKIFRPRSKPISFQQGLDLTGLPVVTFCQGEKKLNFILDTGSTDNIIDSGVLENVAHSVSRKKSSVFGMEGKGNVVPICSITLSYKDDDYTYDYLVCDMASAFSKIKETNGVTVHGIIGSKFFRKFRYVLDFNELIAYSKE